MTGAPPAHMTMRSNLPGFFGFCERDERGSAILKLGLLLALAGMLVGCEEPADSGSRADVASFEVDLPYRGDGVCDDGESFATCPWDCPPEEPCTPEVTRCFEGERLVCSDDGEGWEYVPCPANQECRGDGTCRSVYRYCGDGLCWYGEDPESCPSDCVSPCGDGLCDGWDRFYCPVDCTTDCRDWRSCPEDYICDVSDESGTGVCVPPEPMVGCGTTEECQRDMDCGTDQACNVDCRCEEQVGRHLLALVSTTTDPDLLSGIAPGPHIDAVEHVGGGRSYYAASVVEAVPGPHGGTTRGFNDPTAVLGPPDAISPNGGQCRFEPDNDLSWSMGGDGGYIVLESIHPIRDGDLITVWTLCPDICSNLAEEYGGDYEVFVAIDDVDGPPGGPGWVRLGDTPSTCLITWIVNLP